MKFEGIIPAMLTPFGKDDEVDYGAIGKLVERLLNQGIGGLFVCGSTGEWWALSADERMKIVDKVIEVVNGRIKVMVHVGTTCTRHSIALAKHAKKAGAAAISCLPPVGGIYGPEEIWLHFRKIGEATDMPLYLYHLPQLFGELIKVEKFIDALDTIPTLAGAKFSSYRIDDMIDLKLKAKGRLNILSGCGEQLLSATACGAEGSICTWYNYIPRLANEIVRCVKAGDIPKASACEDKLVRFAMLVIRKHIGTLKWLIGLRGIDVGQVRLPMPYPTPQEKKDWLPKIEATGIFEWCI